MSAEDALERWDLGSMGQEALGSSNTLNLTSFCSMYCDWCRTNPLGYQLIFMPSRKDASPMYLMANSLYISALKYYDM
jgi:hypothetical protein